jgi:hypothetical protein
VQLPKSERRGSHIADAADGGVDVLARLEQLQSSVDTLSVEVERVSEAQRFTSRLLAERSGRNGS